MLSWISQTITFIHMIYESIQMNSFIGIIQYANGINDSGRDILLEKYSIGIIVFFDVECKQK